MGLLLIASGILLAAASQIETCSDGPFAGGCTSGLDPAAVLLGLALAAGGLFVAVRASK